METSFYILLSLKTGDTIAGLGRLDIGNNPQHAHDIFQALVGSSDCNEKMYCSPNHLQKLVSSYVL